MWEGDEPDDGADLDPPEPGDREDLLAAPDPWPFPMADDARAAPPGRAAMPP